MSKKKIVNTLAKCKQIYSLFVLLFISNTFLFSQVSIQRDSMYIVQQDSALQKKMMKDSVDFQYLVVHANAPNYYLDSLKSLVMVKDNNFVGWVSKMKSLRPMDDQGLAPISIQKYHRPEWILFTVMGLFMAIGLVRYFFYVNFTNILFGFYNNRVLAQINKEDTIVNSWPYIFLYAIFSFSLGLFTVVYRSYVLQLGTVEFAEFIKVSVGIALLFILKIVLIRIVGVLFEIERLAREYIVFLYLFYFNSVFLLMPLLLFVIFLPAMYFKFVLIFFVSIIAILFFYKLLKTILTLIGGLRFSIFYLILYLCTLEIAPILILVKSLNK